MRALTSRLVPWMPLLYAAATALFIWLIANLPVVAAPRADADDALFVRNAAHLLNGEWLGPYDRLTLVKGPFYPVWIALSWLLGIPLIVSQALVYALASLALVRGLKFWLRSEPAAFILYVALLLNPATFSVGQLRVLRDGIYVPMTILLFAMLVWWVRWRHERLRLRLALAASFGVVLGCYWCTREEGPWIVPGLAAGLAAPFVAVLYTAPGTLRARFARMRRPLLREAGVAAVGLAAAWLVVGGFALGNLIHYGDAAVVETKQRQFLAAYTALAKVGDPGRDRTYIVVSREGLRRLYDVSPAAAELRPYLDSNDALAFAEGGCTLHKIVPCDGEFRAGLFMWVLRDAVFAAGHYGSAVEARRFYARLAFEVNTACKNGDIACSTAFALPPPFQSLKPAYIGPALRALARATVFSASFDGMGLPRDPLSCTGDDCSRSRAWPFFLQMIGADTFIPIPWLPFPDEVVRHSDAAGPMPFALRYQKLVPVLEAITRFYSLAMPGVFSLGLICFVVAGAIALQRRQVEPLFAIAGVAGIAALSRLSLIAYLDATSLAAINSTYLSPVYPALIVFGLVSIAALGEAAFAASSRTAPVRRLTVAPAE